MPTSKFKIKIVCGFRKDQEFTIDANEAHKAYYIWAHPDSKAIFSTGLAVKGSDIQRIEPDHNATMGWNPTHYLTDDDWAEISRSGIGTKLRNIMASAKEISRMNNVDDLPIPLLTLVRGKYKKLSSSKPLELPAPDDKKLE